MQNTTSNDKQIKYRKKYKFMKVRVKSLILENAALCDEVARIQENIHQVKDERKYLLHKLLEYESELDAQYYKNEHMSAANGNAIKLKKRRTHEDSVKFDSK